MWFDLVCCMFCHTIHSRSEARKGHHVMLASTVYLIFLFLPLAGGVLSFKVGIGSIIFAWYCYTIDNMARWSRSCSRTSRSALGTCLPSRFLLTSPVQLFWSLAGVHLMIPCRRHSHGGDKALRIRVDSFFKWKKVEGCELQLWWRTKPTIWLTDLHSIDSQVHEGAKLFTLPHAVTRNCNTWPTYDLVGDL